MQPGVVEADIGTRVGDDLFGTRGGMDMRRFGTHGDVGTFGDLGTYGDVGSNSMIEIYQDTNDSVQHSCLFPYVPNVYRALRAMAAPYVPNVYRALRAMAILAVCPPLWTD
eukprot:GHVO01070289.1.p2 GENE.GHVO01070289.1~~GHVO01070289.1.p2  ORF type:complete len:111 (+),score=34.65 GHVO01070289.1:249-581(+)